MSVGDCRNAGQVRDDMFDALHTGKAKYSSIFNYPTLNWSDMGTAGWLERVLVGDGRVMGR